MLIANRKVKFREVPQKTFELAKLILCTCFRFRNPVSLIGAYLGVTHSRPRAIEMRNGMTILLSDNPHDVITVLINFCRKEYGPVRKGEIVVDIGGNIGAYSLFALSQGAAEVYSFEANMNSYTVLSRNIKSNNFLEAKLFHLAVTSEAGSIVNIPLSSSPYNKVVNSRSDQKSQELASVTSTNLSEIINSNGLTQIDILKMDCEGSEFDIFMNCDPNKLKIVKRIRMEIHHSKKYTREDLVNKLISLDYSVKKKGSIFWFDRV